MPELTDPEPTELERAVEKAIIGKTFGRLTILSDLGRRPSGKDKYVLTRCSCGQEKQIALRHLRSGAIQSCGCFLKERITATKRKHGHSRCTPEYNAWSKMLNRCRNPNDASYTRYGGRGIDVCDRWLDFTAFLADMGLRPSSEHSIERVENDGHYEPSNCVWATRTEQCRNKRNNRVLELNGQKKTLIEWSEVLGIHRDTLYRRLKKWPVHIALTATSGQIREIKP